MCLAKFLWGECILISNLLFLKKGNIHPFVLTFRGSILLLGEVL